MRFAAPFRAPFALLIACAFPGCDSTGVPTPAELVSLSPAEQSAIVATPVATPPALRVTSATGAAVPGVSVTFTVVAGEGTLTDAVQVTDARGEARVGAWTLGTKAGENVVHATAAGLGTTATFRANGTPGAPATLVMVTQPPVSASSGTLLYPQPAVQLQDRHGNATPVAGVRVTAAALEAGIELEDAVATTDATGLARFTWLTLHGTTGSYTLAFNAPNLLGTVAGSSLTLVQPPEGSCAGVQLDFALGESRRVTLNSARGLTCLDFDAARNAGQQYLVLLENMPMFGWGSDSALFHAAAIQASERAFSYSFTGTPRDAAAAPAYATQRIAGPVAAGDAGHSWDFGAGRIYEHRPELPAGGVPAPYFRAASGQLMDVTGAGATTVPQVGDTIFGIRMVGIAHLGIPTGDQAAVVRHVSDELIIAEDVRLTTTLRRQSGGFNTPLHSDTTRAIAEQYAAIVKSQGDALFDGRYNALIESVNGSRVLAVHSYIHHPVYQDRIWGYTYSVGNYFVWDYWVGTDGSNGGLNQRVQRNVDNLFMHEIAHMREVGLLQRAGTMSWRGNTWLVEGFARFSERLPIAARLLGTPDPSRTANVVLPRNPAFGNSYFRDDVPTYLSVGESMLDGYQNSSYVFDYLADQVALKGGDWRAAIREFVAAGGQPATLDAVVNKWVGGTFPELFTRARLALYLDDIGTTGLPAWTQYHQFRLRDSRPVGTGTDARTAWPKLVPGTAVRIDHQIPAGGAWGYVIDGTQSTASALYQLTGPRTGNAVLSVTRIR
jgi:hypothetical protein